jgi:hypothetical protein
MSTLPLATIATVTAIRMGNELVIHIEGETTGFGGEFVVGRSPIKSLPATFEVRARPGNIGTPGDPNLESFTSGTFVFNAAGIDDEIRVVSADSDETVSVRELDPTLGGKSWTAILDLQPGPGKTPTLRVQGSVEVPSPRHSAKLERAEPQGINPKILLLYTVIVPPEGIHTPQMYSADVEYTEKTGTRYESVTILPEGIYVEVQEVH